MEESSRTSEPVTVSFDARGLRLDTSEDAQQIALEMYDKEVEILILQGNTFGIEAAERLGLELANQPALREAHFKDLFTSRGREEVPEALSHILTGIHNSGCRLTLLDLSDNAIGPIGAPSVIKFLYSPSCDDLEKLYLNNCGLGPEGSTSISACLPRLKKLREFVCGRNRLEYKGATSISRALSELNTLEVLKVNQNGIQVPGITKLVDAMNANLKTMRDIDLSDNTIKSEGSEALSKFISKAKKLRVIRLDDALLENEGFSIICDALSKCPSLNKLDQASFEGNELSGQKIVDLIEITFSNCKPEFTLDLLENEFKPAEIGRLSCLGNKFEVLVDEIDDEDDDDHSGREEGEYDSGNDESGGLAAGSNRLCEGSHSDGFVDLCDFEANLREVSQDFIDSISKNSHDQPAVNRAFLQMCVMVARPIDGQQDFQAVQILCEELGLIKQESTKKKKALKKDAIVYIDGRLSDLPEVFQSFFRVVKKNNEGISCG